MARASATALTSRQLEIAALVSQGLSNRDIGARLFISERTVEWHVEQICNKLGFNARTEIAAWVVASPPAAVPAPEAGLARKPTTFVGRDRELAELGVLLARQRLLTITGAGGIGKTRLAIELAERSRQRFPGGTWLVDLAALMPHIGITREVAHVLGVSGEPGDPVVAVAGRLRDSRALLLLDNCEHVLDAAKALAERLLHECPKLVVLATSRQPLDLPGESVWQLGPLPAEDARRLFLERAGVAAPQVEMTADDPAVAAICDRLEGMPLAIELVVPHLRALSAADLAKALAHSARRLLANADTGRHRSVEATIAWSYDLLGPREQQLFNRLGVAAGWITFEDALALAGPGWESGELLPVLVALVQKSLVVADTSGMGTRYRLLELLRDFAQSRLDESGQLEAARQRHAEHFSALAARAAHELRGPRRTRALQALRRVRRRSALLILVALTLVAATVLGGTTLYTALWAPGARITTVAHFASRSALVYGLGLDAQGGLYFPDGEVLKRLAPDGRSVSTVVQMDRPAAAVAFDRSSGTVIYGESGVFEPPAGGWRVLGFKNGVHTTIVDVEATPSISGVAMDARSDTLYVSAFDIYRVALLGRESIQLVTSGVVAENAAHAGFGVGLGGYEGDGEIASRAVFNHPMGMTVDAAGNLYIADSLNNRVRRISTHGVVDTVAGSGAYSYSGDGGMAVNAGIPRPIGVAVDDHGNLYISEFDDRIRRVDAHGTISTVAGTGRIGFSGDGGLASRAELAGPAGLAVDKQGDLFVFDTYNGRIRKVTF